MITFTDIDKNKMIVAIILLLQLSFAMEYIILTNETLYPAAEKISNIYNDQSNIFHLDTEIVLISSIDNELSIKDYINTQINTHSELEYLLLLGDESSIPSITKSVHCNNTNSEYPSDDFFSSIADNDKPRLKTGRIPASDENEAMLFAEKLDMYLNEPTIGPWKNRVILVADDEIKSGSTIQNEINHTLNSDIIFDKISDYTFIKTLYGPMYEAEYFGSERRLPELSQDIIDFLNEGAAIINYIGHGDVEKWSAEYILDKSRDIDLINIPDNKLPIWIAGTCYFGRYDGVQSMSESLLFDTNGAISIVGATRAISENINNIFLNHFYNYLSDYFTNDLELLRLGDIFLESKNSLTNVNYNSSCNGGYLFDILGDPALPIPFMKYNETSSFPEELTILNPYTFVNSNENSYIELTEIDKDITISYQENNEAIDLSFSYTPNILFSNEFSDSTCFILPIDMINNDSLYIKLYSESLYNSENSYFSISDEINVIYDNNIYEDNLYGPSITFSVDGYEILSNSLLSGGKTITLQISDAHGINTASNIGHNLRYWFNDENESQIIEIEDIDFSTSCIEIFCNITVPDDIVENSVLYVEAWDNLNKKSISSLSFNVIDNLTEQQIFNVYNFPNPMSDRTFFTFQTKDYHGNIYTEVEIYTQSGLLVKKLSDSTMGNFVSIEWNGLDQYSNLVPNGTYLYVIGVSTGQSDFKESRFFSIIK